MTTQEAYEQMREWFSRPGAKLAKSAPGGCFYRSEASTVLEPGLRCAVGCLIPDEAYDPLLDHEVGGLAEWIEYVRYDGDYADGSSDAISATKAAWDALGLDDDEMREFLGDAQRRHDESVDAADFIGRLDKIAAQHSLKVAA